MSVKKILYKVRSILFSLYHYLLNRFIPISTTVSIDTVVAFTSYGLRVENVHYVVASILRQTVRPDRIVLYVYKDDLSNAMMCTKLAEYVDGGYLDIRSTYVDYRSYKKIYMIDKDFPSHKYVVTVDDDVIYPKYWLAALLESKDGFDGVVCGMARMPPASEAENVTYTDWPLLKRGVISPRGLPVGVGGVLYPVGILKPYLSDWSLISKLALTADDIWLNLSCVDLGVPIKVADRLGFHPPELPSEIFKRGLFQLNKTKNEDIYWRVKEYFDVGRLT